MEAGTHCHLKSFTPCSANFPVRDHLHVHHGEESLLEASGKPGPQCSLSAVLRG